MTSDQATKVGEELIEIGERLRKLRKHFDTTTTPCSSCGLQHASNLPEKKAADQIDGALGRLEKVVEYLGESIDRENVR